MPFVGTVPAIKPACAGSVTQRVSVLGTEATVQREYTRALIRDYARDCQVTLVGVEEACRLCRRRSLPARRLETPRCAKRSRHAFVDDGKRTDTIVLACTHYPLLIDRLRQLAPWPVNFIDPAPAIARRVVDLLGPSHQRPARGPTHAIFTSGRAPQAVLARFGFHRPRLAASSAR